MSEQDLTCLDAHFAFGKNWAVYAEKITKDEIEEAVRGLSRLLGGGRLDGSRVLDIGSGSGLHSLAALRLGAAEVVAVDIDLDSVATTRAVLERHAADGHFSVQTSNVFDLDPATWGTFDIVYSWGVLHHTGDMVRAIRCAASMVAVDGQFVFALYRRTWLCSLWKIEKRWYARASASTQLLVRTAYVSFFRLGLWLTGRTLRQHVSQYRNNRGMDFLHDVHDWLGGFPYESASPEEVDHLMRQINFREIRTFTRKRRPFGILGSGCDEYIYAKN